MPETLSYPAAAPPPGAPPVATDTAEPQSDAPLWAAIVPFLALLGVFALAFSSSVKPSLADKVTLPALALMAAVFGYTPFLRRLREDRETASFALCAALFVVYGLARRVVPEDGFSLTFFGDSFGVSYAALLVLAGATFGAFAWLRAGNGWTRALLGALALLALLAFFSLRFLANFYPVGTTATIDPTVLAHFGMQTVEYAALALCCAAVAANATTRRLALLLLPALLLALTFRYRSMVELVEGDDE